MPPAARPQPARPAPGPPDRAEAKDSPPLTGNGPGSHKRKPAARKKPEDRKPRASDEVILICARRMYEETGSVGRDRVENALRDTGYSVSSDAAGRIVREFKDQLKAAPSEPAP